MLFSDFHKPGLDNVPGWVDVISQADRWQARDLREIAVECLGKSKMEAMYKLEIKVRFNLSEAWAQEAYNWMSQRPDPLNLAEASKLDLKTVVEIARLRERWFLDTHNSVNKRRNKLT